MYSLVVSFKTAVAMAMTVQKLGLARKQFLPGAQFPWCTACECVCVLVGGWLVWRNKASLSHTVIKQLKIVQQHSDLVQPSVAILQALDNNINHDHALCSEFITQSGIDGGVPVNGCHLKS